MKPSFAGKSYWWLTLALVSLPILTLETQAQEPLLDASELFLADKIVPIEIELPENDWDEIRTQSRDFAASLGKEFLESPFQWVKADITIDGKKIENVGLRKKGFFGSLDDSRPSLKVKFAKYEDQNPVTGLTHMTLNNNKQDPARVLQYLTYKLFNESGTRAPRCGFAAVTVNGKYLGIYSNVESIRKPMLERVFGDGSGPLLEGTVTDFFPQRIKRFETKNKAAKLTQVEEIAEVLSKEEIDLEAIKALFDVDAFIRYWAMESLVGFWDSYCSNQNNYYIYRNPKNEKFYFVPWGADSSFSKTTPLPPYRIRPRSVHAKAILPNKLYRIPEVQSLYLETLKSFIEKHWQEDKLLAELDRLEGMLSEKKIDEEFESTMNKYRSFIKSRRHHIESELADGAPELPAREQMPIYFGVAANASITFSGKWHEATPWLKTGLGEATISYSEHGKDVPVSAPNVYSEVSKWPGQGATPPATVVISFTRDSDKKQLTIAATLSQALFKPTHGETEKIGGVLIEGMDFKNMQFLSGTMELEKAAMKKGAPVSGKIDVKIARMKGLKPEP